MSFELNFRSAALGIPFQPLPDYHDGAAQALETAKRYMETAHGPYALLVKRQTFLPYSLPKKSNGENFQFSREDALKCLANHFHSRDVVVGTTGMLSRELFEFRASKGDGHERDFLTVGGMGHASSIALGIALQKPNRTVKFSRFLFSLWKMFLRFNFQRFFVSMATVPF